MSVVRLTILGATALCAVGCASPLPCSAARCPGGCCSAEGECVPGTEDQACGGGPACVACPERHVCSSKRCVRSPTADIPFTIALTIGAVPCEEVSERLGAVAYEAVLRLDDGTELLRTPVSCVAGGTRLALPPGAADRHGTVRVDGRRQDGATVLAGVERAYYAWRGSTSTVELHPSDGETGTVVLALEPSSYLLDLPDYCAHLGIDAVAARIVSAVPRVVDLPCDGGAVSTTVPLGLFTVDERAGRFLPLAFSGIGNAAVGPPLVLRLRATPRMGGLSLTWDFLGPQDVALTCAQAGVSEVSLHSDYQVLARAPCTDDAGVDGAELTLANDWSLPVHLAAEAPDGGRWVGQYAAVVRLGSFPSRLDGGARHVRLLPRP